MHFFPPILALSFKKIIMAFLREEIKLSLLALVQVLLMLIDGISVRKLTWNLLGSLINQSESPNIVAPCHPYYMESMI